jgi:hypothetical protein
LAEKKNNINKQNKFAMVTKEGYKMNVLKITAIIAVALTLTACAADQAANTAVTTDSASSKL